MSALEDQLADIVRRVVREELERIGRPLEPLLTAKQVGDLICQDANAVYIHAREGRLKGLYLGSATVRFEPDEVRRFIRDTDIANREEGVLPFARRKQR